MFIRVRWCSSIQPSGSLLPMRPDNRKHHHLTFENLCYITPLEVYLVNSPSRPNSCPPAPVECGGMTPLWNWETCLPVDRAAMPAPAPRPAQGGDGPVPTFPSFGRVPVRPNQPKKPGNQTKSDQIKPNQTIPHPHLGPGPLSRPSRFPLPGSPDLRNPCPAPPNQGKNPCNRA